MKRRMNRRSRVAGHLIAWSLVLLINAGLYRVVENAILDEVRAQAMGVAVAAAAGIDPVDLAGIDSIEAMQTPAFQRVQSHLARIARANPDIRYMYTMTRTDDPDYYVYLVDKPATDDNRNGVIDEDEVSEAPGTRYDIRSIPQMKVAWDQPAADEQVSPDPPYPDLLSGYAPIRADNGETVAILGADVTARTIHSKLTAVIGALVTAWLVIGGLLSTVIEMYLRTRLASLRIHDLSEELKERNSLLKKTNLMLAERNEQIEREMALAQHVQLGFLPKVFPHEDKIAFGNMYVTCAMLGGDLFDVFSLDDHRIGLYMADVAGHGVSAALIASLLKMAVESVKSGNSAGMHDLLQHPAAFMTHLNRVVIKELTEEDFITMIYAVLDIDTRTVIFANAGHTPPVCYGEEQGRAEMIELHGGPALGMMEKANYIEKDFTLGSGDKLILYTDGLTEAMNPEGDEFGEERLQALVQLKGSCEVKELVRQIHDAVEEHRAGREVGDDFSLLALDLRA